MYYYINVNVYLLGGLSKEFMICQKYRNSLNVHLASEQTYFLIKLHLLHKTCFMNLFLLPVFLIFIMFDCIEMAPYELSQLIVLPFRQCLVNHCVICLIIMHNLPWAVHCRPQDCGKFN